MTLAHSPWRSALVGVVLAAAGCSGDSDPCYPVRGIVVYEDGQPAKELAGGSVTFTPREQGRKVSSGAIEDDGTFVLSSVREGDGAVAGKHEVFIEPVDPESGDDDARKRRPPRVILDEESTTQEVTVEPKSNDISLTVRRAARNKR